ncbi:MAG: hypothetical protein QOG15_1537 [Solirubrobacteraceae bacterium]|nr:hypothetical protein [Solirubrobacteraceae bacterium]
MKHRNLKAGVACCLAVGVTGAAFATTASAATPTKVTIKAVTSAKFKPNRYIQDGLRWNKDVYKVKSGGTLHVVNGAADEGPHTFTVVKKSDLPKTVGDVFNCAICNKLGMAHGADPNSEAPPTFQYLENGVGQNTAPNVDRPGDSGVTGPGQKGEFIDLKVTAAKGKTLYFMCIIHAQMQAKVKVK